MKESREQDDDVVLIKEYPAPHLHGLPPDHPLPLHLHQRVPAGVRHVPSATHPRPLARTLSSPLVTYSMSPPQASPDGATVSHSVKCTTGEWIVKAFQTTRFKITLPCNLYWVESRALLQKHAIGYNLK